MTAAAGAARVAARLEELFALGDGPHADRPGLGAAEEEAVGLVAGWMHDAGLRVSRDPVGNLLGVLPGTDPAAPAVWTGSHVDSVPGGGRFDGALGVVAGVEAVARIAARGPLRVSIGVVVFRDEEGWRFANGWFGSRATTGTLAAGALEDVDRDGVSVRAALAALGHHRPERSSPGWFAPPAAFVEVHVEQGTRLEAAGEPVAVVDEIVGMAGATVTFTGRAAHAGATRMTDRADAVRAAAAFVVAVSALAEAAGADDPDRAAVATVGDVSVAGGAANVVAARARCTLDLRAAGPAGLADLWEGAGAAARAAAEAHACAVEVVPTWRQERVVFDPGVGGTLAVAATAALGREVVRARSWAGHDAGILAASGVPAAMLFVRSLRDGASHAPDEHSAPEDVAIAVDALESALVALGG